MVISGKCCYDTTKQIIEDEDYQDVTEVMMGTNQQSLRPGHSQGQNSDQVPFSSTRFINRSGIQSAKKRSLARTSALTDRNRSMLAQQCGLARVKAAGQVSTVVAVEAEVNTWAVVGSVCDI
jgi:hypothetical protein